MKEFGSFLASRLADPQTGMCASAPVPQGPIVRKLPPIRPADGAEAGGVSDRIRAASNPLARKSTRIDSITCSEDAGPTGTGVKSPAGLLIHRSYSAVATALGSVSSGLFATRTVTQRLSDGRGFRGASFSHAQVSAQGLANRAPGSAGGQVQLDCSIWFGKLTRGLRTVESSVGKDSSRSRISPSVLPADAADTWASWLTHPSSPSVSALLIHAVRRFVPPSASTGCVATASRLARPLCFSARTLTTTRCRLPGQGHDNTLKPHPGGPGALVDRRQFRLVDLANSVESLAARPDPVRSCQGTHGSGNHFAVHHQGHRALLAAFNFDPAPQSVAGRGWNGSLDDARNDGVVEQVEGQSHRIIRRPSGQRSRPRQHAEVDRDFSAADRSYEGFGRSDVERSFIRSLESQRHQKRKGVCHAEQIQR